MINNVKLEEIECEVPPPCIDFEKHFLDNNNLLNENKISEGNKTDNKWEYYDKNKNFLLRFGLIKVQGNEDLIRFEVLDTKTISEDYEMFAEFFKRENLVNDSEITKKNINTFTHIFMLFETYPPEGEINKENNEFKLIITKNEGKKCVFSLKKMVCEDENFFQKNYHPHRQYF